MDKRPIGIFDSGLGGLSTVRAVKKLMPNEDVIYFGDTGRVPYGTRSKETIETYTAQDVKFLRSFDCKMIVVACGTVSTVCADIINQLDEHSTGITKPSVIAAVKATKNKKIGLLGTSATVNSGAFDSEIHKLDNEIEIVSNACPLLVSLVENNWIDIDDEVTNLAVKRYLEPLLAKGVDTIILGCTHFPLLAPIIQKNAGENITLIDTGYEEAKYVQSVLESNDLRNETDHIGVKRYFVSDKTQNFCETASTLLGENISDKCEFVDILKFI